MTSREILEYEATYLIYGNKTMEKASKALGISLAVLQRHINKELKELDRDLYNKVKERLDDIINERKRLGGRKGRRTTGYSLDYINSVCDDVISQFTLNGIGISIREIASMYGIPKSTVYDLFSKYLDEERLNRIKDIFRYNSTVGKSKTPERYSPIEDGDYKKHGR